MVIQGQPIYEGKGKTTLTNPRLIIEVLSKSTQDYDKGTKFDYYRSLSDLHEYILLDQYQYYGQQFAKNPENKWVLTEFCGEDVILTLESLPVQISLKDLYNNVDFNATLGTMDRVSVNQFRDNLKPFGEKEI